jgi:hypothetical protein
MRGLDYWDLMLRPFQSDWVFELHTRPEDNTEKQQTGYLILLGEVLNLGSRGDDFLASAPGNDVEHH